MPGSQPGRLATARPTHGMIQPYEVKTQSIQERPDTRQDASPRQVGTNQRQQVIFTQPPTTTSAPQALPFIDAA
jgi:hypothetical protein